MKTFLWCLLFPTLVLAEQLKCSYDFDNKIIVLPEVRQAKTFEKHEGKMKYQATIKDFINFSELDNYLVISQGDKSITYSLSCQKFK